MKNSDQAEYPEICTECGAEISAGHYLICSQSEK